MKLYVCYGTFGAAPEGGGHPCGAAYKALKDAGHDPEVVKSYGFGVLPSFMNPTHGRREAKRLTGSHKVPVLVTDDDEVVADSKEIVKWAQAHPVAAPASPPS